MEKDKGRYRLLIENLPNAFAYHEVVTDQAGVAIDYTFLEINRAFEEMTGLKREEIIGKKVSEVLPGIEKSEFDWISVYGRVALTGESAQFETYSEHLDRWYNVSAYSDERGYFCVVFNEITSQKQLKRNLEASEKRYQSVVNAQQEMITRYLPDTTLTFVNDAYCRALGKTRQELLGKKFLEFISPQMQEETLNLISKLTPENPIATHENQVIFPDGRVCWQEWTENALFSIDGHLEELQGVGRDITKRKLFEEALNESQLMLRTIIDSIPQAVFWKDSQSRYLGCNKAFARHSGISCPEEVIGKTDYELPYAKNEASAYRAKDREVIDNNRPELNIIETVTNPDGTTMWVKTSKMPLLDNHANPIGVLGIYEDITDQKKAERILEMQVRERTAVDAFTYSVSHDLQAPLRRIEGFGEALLEESSDQLTEQANDYINRIIKQIKSMKFLTDALINLSKVVSKQLVWEKVDLSILVKSHLNRFAFNEPGRNVEVVLEPEQLAEADVELINVALGNLLDNAWKFSSQAVNARIEFGSFVKEGRTVYYVRDNGVGFDMEHSDKLYNPFQKLHSESDFSGSGFGLNIVYRIISRHGGEIWADSKKGEGAVFFFTLS